MPGVGRPRPRPAGPRPRQAPPGQQRPGSARGPRDAGYYDPQGQQTRSDPPGQGRGPQQAGYPGQGHGPGRQNPGPAHGWADASGYQPGRQWAGAGQQGQPGPVPPGAGGGAGGSGAGQARGGMPGQGQGQYQAGQLDPGWQAGNQAPRPGQEQAWAQEQRGYGQPGTAQPGAGPRGFAQPGAGQSYPDQGAAGYGQAQYAAEQQAGFGQPGFAQGRPSAGRYGAGAGQPPYDQGQRGAGQHQYGNGQYGGQQTDGQFWRSPRDTGSWQAAEASPDQGQGWAPGTAHPGASPRNTGSWETSGQVWTPGPSYPGADSRSTGSWQATPGPHGPGRRTAAGWHADGQDEFGAGPFDAGPFDAGQSAGGQRDTGSWHAAGAEQAQGWTPRPGHGGRDTGSWQAAPDQEYGWNPGQGRYEQQAQDQYGQQTRNTGSWQAAGGPPGPGWAGQGQQPYPGQQHQGQPYQGAPDPGLRNTGDFGRAGSPVIRQRDSALPDPPPGPKGPIAAIENDNVAAFARDLRVLRSKTGLDYPDMAEKSHYTMRTLASAAGGLRLPTLPVLIAYVNACDGDVTEWEERWGRLTKSGKRTGQVALLAGGQDQDRGPIPQGPRQTGEIYVITSARQRDERW
jgi:hypothetical protein